VRVMVAVVPVTPMAGAVVAVRGVLFVVDSAAPVMPLRRMLRAFLVVATMVAIAVVAMGMVLVVMVPVAVMLRAVVPMALAVVTLGGA
jgi:hypothetical protein